jgi:carbon-monoxide dehydrogenase medium subunit
VIPGSFDYVRPDSIDAAVQAITAAGEDGKVLAGGQSLIPILRLRLAFPSTVVDLGGVPELRGVRDDGDAIVIGAMTTHHDILGHDLVRQHAPLIAQATATVADPQVRHLGTFGGALAHADPAGDLAAVALALDCEFVAAGPGGQRRIAAADFFLDYLTTALAADEILTAIRVPKLGAGWSSHYEKFNRVAQAWSIVAVAALVRRDGGSITEARIGLTNMGPTPLRAAAVERALAGSPDTGVAIDAAAALAAEGTQPPSDLSGQADYRKHLARVLTRRAILATAGAAVR